MRLKTKMLKNLISVLCAATIATSGVVTSVSAVKTTGNTSSKEKQAEKIQATWRGYKYRKNVKKFDEVAGDQYEEKLGQYNKKYSEVKSLLDKTTHKKRASLEAEVKLISEKIIAEQAAIQSDLERIQKEFDIERVKSLLVLLDEATNKLNGIENFLRAVEIYNAFNNDNLALARWVVANNLHKDNPAYEDIKQDAKKVHDVYAAVGKDFDNEEKVNEFKTLANKTSQKMREFKENNTKAQSEVEKLHGKFEKEVNDFLGWAMENGIDLKVYDPKSRQMVFPPKGRVLEFIMEKCIKRARLVYEQIGNDFSDAQKVDLYKRLVEVTTKSMKEFKEYYEKRQNELINSVG